MPLSQYDFASLGLNAALVDNLSSLGYTEMTPIQAQALPPILANKDVIAQAKTGSGKTATFALGLLNKLDVKRFRVQTVVLCPTRELADQVAVEIRKLARGIHNIKVLTLCGGMAFGPQVGSLEHGAHIIVGTPGRVEEHLRKANLNLDNLTTLVLDEADRMLDMGFQQALDDIISYMPKQRQTLLFSATYPAKIEKTAQRIMQSPVMVEVQDSHSKQSIVQSLYEVENDDARVDAVRLLLQAHQPETTQPQGKAQAGQSRPGTAQPPGDQQQQQKNAGRQQKLFDEVTKRHRGISRDARSLRVLMMRYNRQAGSCWKRSVI